MERGLYIAASGMMAEGVRQDLIAHDLANASTPGYKADRVSAQSFGAMLLTESGTGREVGPLGMGVSIAEQVTDLRPGPVRETGGSLDMAIEGEGYFAIRTGDGVRYTRNGQFRSAADGTLTTAQGEPVLGRNGRPVTLDADGTVPAGTIDVVVLRNVRKEGEGLLIGTPARGVPGTVRAGALEGSGTDAITSMTAMIASLRSFEAGQRVISTIDSTLQKATTQVGQI